MAIKARDPTKENTERTIPLQYQEFAKIFSDKEVKHFPPSRPWDHQIQLKPGAPDVINGKVYPLTLEETKVQDKYIDEGLEKGYLRPGEGLYGSSSFYVAKKNGQLCPIVDYRILNQHTVMDITLLPLIPQIYDDLRDKVLFSKFNIRWGYNNIQVAEEDCWKTGFKITRGLFESNVMPFGLCNAPATFTCMRLMIFRPLEVQYPGRCRYYMDDF